MHRLNYQQSQIENIKFDFLVVKDDININELELEFDKFSLLRKK